VGGAAPTTAAPISAEVVPTLAPLPTGCPTHTYLGEDPTGSDWPDWSEQAQGVANDGHYWFFTGTTGGLFKYEANWRAVESGDDIGRIAHVGMPPELDALTFNHFGDPDYYDGYVFVPFEHNSANSEEQKSAIGVFRASDLAFVDWVDMRPYQPKAGWVAIDPTEEILYTSTDHIVAGTPLLRYKLDVSKIENGIAHDFLTQASSMAIRDANGGEVSGQFIYVQGGVFTPWGDLYLAVGHAKKSAAESRGGLHLFRRTEDGSAFQLIESSVNESGHEGEPVFAYEYHPGDWVAGEEPEGIDWWNRGNGGQLHAILLDNDAFDDTIWFKHYSVEYSACVGNGDTDGDGLSDYNEVYAYNTHPRIKDTDQDGQWDGDEVVCTSDPLDKNSLAPDLDADHKPDCVDPDDDGDGQSDSDETTCGSNPRDATSKSGDFDKDAHPDCVDDDDDNDGVVDGKDRCAKTVIPDQVIPTSGVLKPNRYALRDNDYIFDGGPATPVYTTIKTGGCNATQIADAMHLGVSHYQYGITRSALDTWIASAP